LRLQREELEAEKLTNAQVEIKSLFILNFFIKQNLLACGTINT
jgi:hypothetical protein